MNIGDVEVFKNGNDEATKSGILNLFGYKTEELLDITLSKLNTT